MDKKRGLIASQIIETARNNLDLLDNIGYGEVVFYIKNDTVWRAEFKISRKINEPININKKKENNNNL